jgi:hypothetical protein
MITTRQKFELIPLFRVRKILNVSWYRMMEIVRDGELRVFNVSRAPIDLSKLGEDGSGLRVRSDDLDDYINSIMIGTDDDYNSTDR